MDLELESFKTGIDLRAYAQGQGYELDPKDSWRGSAVMRHPATGDKVIIKREADGHYVYFSVRDDSDHGTIVDFIQRRAGLGIGAIRKELRAWSGAGAVVLPSLPALQKIPRDRAAVEARYASMRVAHRHPYLEEERGIPALVLQYWRFDGRIRIDGHQNAVFPHFDAAGLCGYELKNKNFTGFAAGGSKGLWLSKAITEDNRLVLCESAIEALSFCVLFPDGRTRFASIGGKMNPTQPELIRAQILRMPAGSEILAAMNNDDPGRALAEAVRKEFGASGRPDLTFRRQEPEGVNDWNDLLRARPKPPLPYRHDQPSVA